MKDSEKTKEQLISEVNKLRRQIDDLYKSKPDNVSEVWTGDHDEKLTRAIVEQSPLGISIRNSKGKLLGVNKSWKKIWGVPQETIDKYLASEPVELAFDEKDSYLDEWLPQIKNIYNKGGMLNIPLLYLGNHRSAKPRWVSQTFYAVKDSNGSVDRVVILTEDITDRKSVEEALHSSNERFKDLVELLPEAIFETDRDMNLTFANRRAFELFGYTNEDIKQGLSAFELVVPEDRDRAKTNFAKRIKGDDTGTSEYMALKKDGSVFPILFNAQSILKESELFGLKGIVVDITERRRIEEELRISEERYKNIFDNALVGLFRTRLSDGMFIALNSVNAKQLNLPIDEIIGKKRAIDLYVNPDQREELIAILKRDGEAHDFETNMTLHDGSNGTFSISVKAYPEKDYMEGAVINITERKRAEKSLKKSEEKYRTLLSNIPDVVWTTDNIGKTTFISPNVEEVYGYTPNEIYEHDEKLWFGRIHPDHRENVKKEYAKFYKNKSQLDLEYKIQRKDGQWIWLHDRGIKIFDNNGIAHVDGIFSDITKRKHAEDALLMEKERAQGYLDIAGSMLLALDSKGKMILLNKKACQILGCSSEDWLGKDWFETFLPKQIRREVSHVYNQLMSGKIEPVEYYENPVLTVEGEERLIAWHNSITKDNNGKIIGVLSSGADITERRHAEEALRISEKRQRSLLANLPVGIYRATPDGKLLTANPAMVEMFGYDSEEELCKIPISDLYFDSRKRQKLISRLSNEAMVTNFEVYLLRKDGNKIWVAASVQAVSDDSGEIKHLDGILQDITGRRTAEEELAKVNINLEAESNALHQKNVALKEILKHIEEEKLIIKRQIANNIDQVLVPALKKVRRHDGTVNKYYYDLFSNGLKDLANNSGDRLHKYAKLSSRELEICNMIKQGVTSKVISNELYITIETVKKHRASIRRKLGISNKSISLSNFLRNL